MSSGKMRLKLRLRRLQDMYKQLGRDPNAKGNHTNNNFIEYEIKSIIVDFDKIVRK